MAAATKSGGALGLTAASDLGGTGASDLGGTGASELGLSASALDAMDALDEHTDDAENLSSSLSFTLDAAGGDSAASPSGSVGCLRAAQARLASPRLASLPLA